jgi:hypothetical protein
MTLTPEQLDEIEKGCEGVTPGPWVYSEDGDDDFISSPKGRGDVHCDTSYYPSGLKTEDAMHFARLDPTTVRELVRLARMGADLEQGLEQYVRGIRVYVPISTGDF